MMLFFYAGTALLLLFSFIKDRRKSKQALIIAWKRFVRIAPDFVLVLILMSLILAFLPNQVIAALLGNGTKWVSVIAAALIGSVTLMPGFVAFPLCGILLKQGVSYMVLSAFTTTLMMVGVLTFPVERAYFGTRATLLRNALSLMTALLVAAVTGLFFGELG
ncbi:MAG TPA: hypothetical protein PLF44_01060 [Candidatus Mcinerneyibacteriales bacterium]|nr:hypothetical protein [Candidatus Mcinerneyibacteriales bacterium]HPJ69448.1 hypothetical protein [Candidatus Mcinerneyibacteriales bacterium]